MAVRTVAVYGLIFGGLALYIGVVGRETPSVLFLLTAILFICAVILKIWILSILRRRIVDEKWIEKAIDLGVDMLLLVICVAAYVVVGRAA